MTCEAITGSHVMPGWGCCLCRGYNGIQRLYCRHCGHQRCDTVVLMPVDGPGKLVAITDMFDRWVVCRIALTLNVVIWQPGTFKIQTSTGRFSGVPYD